MGSGAQVNGAEGWRHKCITRGWQIASGLVQLKGLNGIPEVGYLRNVVMKAIWRHQSG